MWQISWMFSLIPDSVLAWLVHGLFFGGLVLTIATKFSSRLPFISDYAKVVKLIAIPMLLAGIYFEGGLTTELKWRAKVAELEAQVKASEQKSKEANTKLDSKIKEKTKVVKEVQIVIKERIKEVEKRIDAECKVDSEAISIINDAARNVGGKK